MNSPKIIIVEDDITLGESFADIFRLNDHTVDVIVDGAHAVERILREHPRLLVLDMHLPHVDGLEILTQLRALPELADLKVAVVSADATMVSKSAPLADATLLKPIGIRQLLGLLELLT
ncbi:MAG: response regulator [Anaerolineae bacterium]|nr:response regulator [Anaerolineae bacterium]